MRIASLDIETTDRLAVGGFIVEVGICIVDLESMKITKGFASTVCEDGLAVSRALFGVDFETIKLTKERIEKSWIYRNSTLTVDEILLAPTLEEVRESIQSVFDSVDLVAAYNQNFDFDFMESRGFVLPNAAPDPSEVGKVLHPKTDHRGQLRYHKMEDLYRIVMNEPTYKEKHRAYADALDTAKIILEFHKQGKYIKERKNG